jgi:enoyl-CoA hydratase/carnithine racemase/predicted dinucleotide-binding enzyme
VVPASAAVAGAGGIGAQLAMAIADAGIPVLLADEHEEALRRGLEHARGLWQRRIEAGRMAADELERKLGLIELVRGYERLVAADIVLEAAPDRLEDKQAILAELDELISGRAILATTTARLSLGELVEVTVRPDRLLGLRFPEPIPSSRMVEIVQGELTSPEAMLGALSFARSLRRAAIRCADSPGLVLARVLEAADRRQGDDEQLRRLRMLVEACRVVEEGVASARDVDIALAVGGGLDPPPLAAADRDGLDASLKALRQAAVELGPELEPPPLLRRLVAQGRLGVAAGQGFFAYPRPDRGWEQRPVKLETRGEIAVVWFDRPPANSISPEVARALREAWEEVVVGQVRALVLASANPTLFCAGADIKEFQRMGSDEAARLVADMHALLDEMERSDVVTIAAVGGMALGGGCELAMACDVRVAADSASFGQPEINLGIIPGFGGTQRLPRLAGLGKALELCLSGEPLSAAEAFELGLVNELVEDHELLDAALGWARRLARQAPRAVALIKRLVRAGEGLRAGLAAERSAFVQAFASEDAAEGFAAFREKREPRFSGRRCAPGR